MSDLAVVTGGTGFVGGALVRHLVESGEPVRVLARPGSDRRLLSGLHVEIVEGDLTVPSTLARCLKGCGSLFHVAALYRLWTQDRKEFYRVNVDGTRHLLQAAGDAGVRRIVYTSTVGVLGTTQDGGPATEETPVTFEDMVGDYKKSKFLAETVAQEFAGNGLPVVVVNPSTPIGPGDVKPTPTGQMIVDFLRGKMWAYLDTGLNLVPVKDVAVGHRLARDRGHPGQRYILGGPNLSLREIFTLLGRIAGVRPPRLKVSPDLILPLAVALEWIADRSGRPPAIAADAIRMARKRMFFDPGKAIQELGLPQSSVEDALDQAARWFRANRYAPA